MADSRPKKGYRANVAVGNMSENPFSVLYFMADGKGFSAYHGLFFVHYTD